MVQEFPIGKIREITFPPPPTIPEPADGNDLQIARMNLNEAPYPPSPKAIAAALDAMENANRYPDHGCSALASLVSDRTGVPVERISFGNGSGEILIALAMMSIDQGDVAIMPSPTFPTCGKGVQIAGGTIVNVPLRSDGTNDVFEMLAAITERTRLFYLCTPNNPTGGILSPEELEKAAVGVPENCLLVVDEAYFEFADKQCGVDVLAILGNRTGPWAVTRSFSKAYCMAGMRVGYALTSDTEIQQGLWQLRPNFNVSRPSLAAAVAAMQDESYLDETLTRTIKQRQRLGDGMVALGFGLLPSFANFLTVRPPIAASSLAQALAEYDILVQALSWPDANGSLRITVDSAQNTDRIIKIITKILG